jgi:hypothetical protein
MYTVCVAGAAAGVLQVLTCMCSLPSPAQAQGQPPAPAAAPAAAEEQEQEEDEEDEEPGRRSHGAGGGLSTACVCCQQALMQKSDWCLGNAAVCGSVPGRGPLAGAREGGVCRWWA